MNLVEIRTWFVQQSGRYDLVIDATDYVDNGANRIINMANRWLDRETEYMRELARAFRSLIADDWFVKCQDLRTLKEVWYTSTTAKTQLVVKTFQELQLKAGNSFSQVTSGTPLYYCPAYIKSNSLDDSETDGIGSAMDIMPDANDWNGVIIYPPTSEAITLEIVGKFYTNKLTLDANENYWSVNEPGLLVMATLRQLEIFHRNTQGANDWENAIRKELLGLEKDSIETEITGITSIGV